MSLSLVASLAIESLSLVVSLAVSLASCLSRFLPCTETLSLVACPLLFLATYALCCLCCRLVSLLAAPLYCLSRLVLVLPASKAACRRTLSGRSL